MLVNYKKAYILVTGGAGYIGRVLIEKLLEKKYGVLVFDNSLYANPIRERKEGLLCIQADIRNEEMLRKVFTDFRIKAVVHLAGISEDYSRSIPENLYESVNYRSFLTLLNLACTAKVKRVIFVSSATVYGKKVGAEVVTEMTPPGPLTLYGKYKLICEKELMKRTWPFVVSAVRFAAVCGYSPRMRFDLPHNALVRDAFFKKELRIPPDEEIRPTIHIDDAARVITTLLEADREVISGEIFNAGYENNSWHRWTTVVQEIFKTRMGVNIVPTRLNYSYALSSKKLEDILDFRPEKGFEDAAEELIEIFRTKTVVNPYDSSFYNTKILLQNGVY